jgi:hypothetical protein
MEISKIYMIKLVIRAFLKGSRKKETIGKRRT